jgi:hypothetical protein
MPSHRERADLEVCQWIPLVEARRFGNSCAAIELKVTAAQVRVFVNGKSIGLGESKLKAQAEAVHHRRGRVFEERPNIAMVGAP